MEQPWTEDSVARTLINPNYCLTDPPVVTEEKWIEANAKLVQKMGVEPYLFCNTTKCKGLWSDRAVNVMCGPAAYERLERISRF
jgi:uncharacterized protein (DUF362 family)